MTVHPKCLGQRNTLPVICFVNTRANRVLNDRKIMAIRTLKQIDYGFGGRPLLAEVDLQIEPGERIGILGRNGAG